MGMPLSGIHTKRILIDILLLHTVRSTVGGNRVGGIGSLEAH